MDGKSPLELELPLPLEKVKKKLLKRVDRTAVGKLLRECGMVN